MERRGTGAVSADPLLYFVGSNVHIFSRISEREVSMHHWCMHVGTDIPQNQLQNTHLCIAVSA